MEAFIQERTQQLFLLSDQERKGFIVKRDMQVTLYCLADPVGSTADCHETRFWNIPVILTLLQCISTSFILISSHPLPGLPRDLFPSGFFPEISYAFLISPCMLHASAYLFFLFFITLMFAEMCTLWWPSFCFILLLCPFISHPSLWFSSQNEWPGFTPIQNKR